MQRLNDYDRTLSLLLLKRSSFITDGSAWWPFWGEGPFHFCKMGSIMWFFGMGVSAICRKGLQMGQPGGHIGKG